ncbi:hypothetical protein ES703_09432 [subsurface metagenome]
MADHIIESNFCKEVVDRAKRRIWGMVTRFSLKSQDADIKEIDEDGSDSDDLSC